jgi:hypothetical protein
MIDRKLCRTEYGRFPSWPCPVCGSGTLDSENEAIRAWPASGVYEAIDEGHMFRWDDYGVFSAILKCLNRSCRQGVAVWGDYSSHELDEPPMAYEHRYNPRGFYPALMLIDIPDGTPVAIRDSLLRSFNHFWGDAQACAGAIRVAIEGIAESLGQPANLGGKFVPLGVRLAKLKLAHPDVVEAASVIKDVGNDGAHGKDISREELLNCYELLEIELRTLFTDNSHRRRKLIDGLRK